MEYSMFGLGNSAAYEWVRCAARSTIDPGPWRSSGTVSAPPVTASRDENDVHSAERMRRVSPGIGAAERSPAFLFAAEGAKKIIEYNSQGKVAWEHPAEMSRDVWLASDQRQYAVLLQP